jgi:hypothetical protein
MQKRTDNMMAKRKGTKWQTMVHEHNTKNRATRTPLQSGVNAGALEG